MMTMTVKFADGGDGVNIDAGGADDEDADYDDALSDDDPCAASAPPCHPTSSPA